MQVLIYIGAGLFGYAVGSFPSAVLVAKAKGVNIFEEGSKNPGATNAGRLLGFKYFLVVSALDIAKGVVGALPGVIMGNLLLAWVGGIASFIGHLFPFTTRFRGGKGVATAAGVFLAIHPELGLMLFCIFGIIYWLTKTVSIASIVTVILAPVGLWFEGAPIAEIIGLSFLALLILIRHRANLLRIIKGEELSFGKDSKPEDQE